MSGPSCATCRKIQDSIMSFVHRCTTCDFLLLSSLTLISKHTVDCPLATCSLGGSVKSNRRQPRAYKNVTAIHIYLSRSGKNRKEKKKNSIQQSLQVRNRTYQRPRLNQSVTSFPTLQSQDTDRGREIFIERIIVALYFSSCVLFSFETFRNEKKLGFSKRNGRVWEIGRAHV